MNKKKSICSIIVFTLIMSTLLVGCKTQTVTKTGGLKPVNLTWYLDGSSAPADANAVNAEISKYTKKLLNANVNIQLFDYASYGTKISTMIASGDPADLVFTAQGGSIPFRPNVDKGAFISLNSLLSKYGKDITKALGTTGLKAGTVDGQIYGIPVNKDRAHTNGIMFNKKMVDKYKFDISKVNTLEDLEPMLKIIKEKENGNIVSNFGVGTNTGNSPMTLLNLDYLSGDKSVPVGLYGNNDPSNTKMFNFFESKEVLAQLKTVREFYLKGYIRADAPTLKNDLSGKQGKGFVSFPQMKPNGDTEMSNATAQFVQRVLTKPVTSNDDLTNSMMAITKGSQNPERAMMLLNSMYSDKKLVNLAVNGIEGKNYTKVSANVIKPIDSDPFYVSNVGWKFGNQFLDYLSTKENPNKWNILNKFNKDATVLNSVGFSFDTSDVQTEMAAISSVSAEYQPIIITGSVDPVTYLAKYNAALKQAGIDKVTAEMQKQYNAFLAKKKK